MPDFCKVGSDHNPEQQKKGEMRSRPFRYMLLLANVAIAFPFRDSLSAYDMRAHERVVVSLHQVI